ncbi:MAG: hypothetical protein RI907_3073 [Pseudomonadota bacterium]|jgi:fucose 4-O-acetylase-like acetyltransferase
MSSRIIALDLAKGTAILLVVLGHIVARNNVAPGAEWYIDFHNLVYAFHMPLFMTLSGMSLGASWRHRSSAADVLGLIRKRVQQLMVPFLAFGLLILAGKLIAMRFVPIDNPPSGGLQDVLAIVLTPINSSVGFLWYVYVLSLYYLVMPWVLQYAERWGALALLALAVAGHTQDGPRLFSLHMFIHLAPFFVGGVWLGQRWQWVVGTVLPARTWPLWALPFAAALIYGVVEAPLPEVLVGALSVPAILTSHQLIRGRVAEWLTLLGQHTLAIYLMNTLFIGLAKVAFTRVVPWEGHWFYLHFVVLGLAGLLLPIAVKKLAQRWAPPVAQYL